MEWSLLAPLGSAERERVMSSTRPRSFAKGEVICHEGDPADSLHLVAAGRLSVHVSNRGGDSAMLSVLVPGDSFGELSLLHTANERHRTATVAALEPARTLALSAAAFQALVDEHPAVNQLLVAALAARVEELSGRLLESLYVGLDRRVIRTLLRLSSVYDGPAPETTIPLAQHQLADLVGGTRPSVNQVLTKLAAQNIVRVTRGQVSILDAASLRRRAGYDSQ